MRTITAKFSSKCAETGRKIKKGESCIYDADERKVYHPESSTAKAFNAGEQTDQAGAMVQANEEAFFDNFCINNNI